MRAADCSGDTLGLQEKAPSRGMRYLKNIQINFVLPQETHHHLLIRIHFETRTHREGTTRTHGCMAHLSALGLVLVMYCSMLQHMGVEAKARATEEDGQCRTLKCCRNHGPASLLCFLRPGIKEEILSGKISEKIIKEQN